MAAENEMKFEFTADTQKFVSSLNEMMSKMGSAANDATGTGRTIEGAFRGANSPVDALSRSVADLGGKITTSLGGAARNAGSLIQTSMTQAVRPIETLQAAVRTLSTDFNKASESGKALASSTGQAKTAGIAIGLIAAGAAAVAATRRFAEAQDKIDELADSSNIGDSSLRKFAVAGARTGTELKDIAGFATSAHNAIRTIKEKTDEGAVALDFLGLSLSKIKNASPEEQMRQIADAILAMGDSATASEIAQTLLGTSVEKLRAAFGDSATQALALSDAENELVKAQEANANGYTVLNQSIEDFKTAMADAKAGAGALAQYLVGYLIEAFDFVIRKAQAVASAVANMFSSVANMVRGATGFGDASSVPAAGIGPVLPTGGDSRSVPKTGIGPIQPGSDSESGAAASRSLQTYKERLATLQATDVQKDTTAKKDMKNADAEAKRYGAMKKAAEDAKGGGGGGKSGKSDDEKELDKLKAQAEALKDLYDPMYKLNKETEKFNDLFAKGLISADIRDKAIAKATEDAEKRMKELNKSTDMMGKTFDDIKEKAKSWSDTLIDGIVDGKKSFGDMISSMLKDIAKISVKNALAPMFDGLTGGKGKMGGSAKSPLPGAQGPSLSMLGGIGKRASGGAADGLTLVGERGPELAMFGQGGFVNNASDTKQLLSGGGATTSVSNIVVNVPQGTTPDQGAKIAKYMDQALEARIRKSQVDQRRARPLRG